MTKKYYIQIILTLLKTSDKYDGIITQWHNKKEKVKVLRYQRGNRKPQVEERQTTQWPKEKGFIDKTYCFLIYEEVEDTKGVIRIRMLLQWFK